jgi:hypothetical protein
MVKALYVVGYERNQGTEVRSSTGVRAEDARFGEERRKSEI